MSKNPNTKVVAYNKHLADKQVKAQSFGFNIQNNDLHASNFPHQKDIIKWAVEGGKRAIFASFGLGKTQMQLELMRIILKFKGGKGVIVCPLGVKLEFQKDAQRLGMELKYVTTQKEIEQCQTPYMITNYERVRDGDIDVNSFNFASLDEGSVLRTDNSKTHHKFIKIFKNVPYRYVFTATPSPNSYIEIIFYAVFLGLADKSIIKTRFFKRDSTKADNLTLHPHKEEEFWQWVSSWATFITKPSDLGYNDFGYDLPEIEIIWHEVKTDNKVSIDEYSKQYSMIADQVKGIGTETSQEKNSSLPARLDKALEIINKNPDNHYLLWHYYEYERLAIQKAKIDSCKTVYGSQNQDLKESLLIDFAEGKYKVLATKPEIAGLGCNFQHYCNTAIYLDINYSFEEFIQSIHRIQRFGQNQKCIIHIIYTSREGNIKKALLKKWQQHKELVAKMIQIIKENGLTNNQNPKLERYMFPERQEKKGASFTAINNDCVFETMNMPDNSIDQIVTSIPFGTQYSYTELYNDFGHSDNNEHFFKQLDYLTPELLRILKPGRIACIHVKDRIVFGNFSGAGVPTIDGFHADCIHHYKKHGFLLMGMITVETDVVRENNATYRLSYSEMLEDATKMGVGSPEYIIILRKPQTNTSQGYADERVKKSKEEYSLGKWQIDARSRYNSNGNHLLSFDEIKKLPASYLEKMFQSRSKEFIYDYQEHIRVAEQMSSVGKLSTTHESLRVNPKTNYVWGDILRFKTLNAEQTRNKEQNHLCPLQLDLIERLITMYSNKGETILDPFGGIMSVPYTALQLGRKAIGIELNNDYFRCGLRYLKDIENKISAPKLFDLLNVTQEA